MLERELHPDEARTIALTLDTQLDEDAGLDSFHFLHGRTAGYGRYLDIEKHFPVGRILPTNYVCGRFKIAISLGLIYLADVGHSTVQSP